MNTKKTFGKIFKVKLDKKNTIGYALAVSDSNYLNNIEFLQVLPQRKKRGKHTIPITLSNYVRSSLLGKYFLHTDKFYLLNSSSILCEVAEMTTSFMENIVKKLIKDKCQLYWEKFHKSKLKIPFVAGRSYINYGGRIFDEKEILNLIDSSLDFWLTAGRYAENFEKDFADFLGIKYCSLVNSGSSANLLAFMSLTSSKLGERAIKKGDEVITTAAGFPTTIAPIIQFGAIPVFVDITIPTYNIDCSQIETSLSERTKAIMVAHTLGNPFDIQTLKELCNKHNLWLIEDNCDALGSRYLYNGKWGYTGTFGNIATSSFYPSHHITMGEGGAIYTNDSQIKRIVDSLRDWGRDCWCLSGTDNTCQRRFEWQLGELPYGYDHKYIYSHFGYNLRLTDMQAAIGCAQLKKLPSFTEARKRNWGLLKEGLSDLDDKLILPEPTPNSDPSWFGFLLTVREDVGFTRDEIVRHLESKGIQTRMLFAGNLIRHPCFDEIRNRKELYRVVGNLKNTDRIMKDTFWIGVYPGITNKMIEYIITVMKNFCSGCGKK